MSARVLPFDTCCASSAAAAWTGEDEPTATVPAFSISRAIRPITSSSLVISGRRPLERDDFSSNRHPALIYCLSMIFSENRCPVFGILLQHVFAHVFRE